MKRRIVSLILIAAMLAAAFINAAAAQNTGINELITNSEFEEDLDGWSATNANISWLQDGADNTNGCAYVEVKSNNFGDIYQRVTLKAGKIYHMSAYVRPEESIEGCQLLFSSSAGTVYGIVTSMLRANEWNRVEYIYKPTETDLKGDSVDAKFYLRLGKGWNQGEFKINYSIDNFSCMEYDYGTPVNGGFEYGKMGWNVSGADIEVRDGGAGGTNKSAYVTVKNNNLASRAYQQVVFEPGVLYEISFWLKLDDVQNARAVINHKDSNDSGIEYPSEGTAVGSEWKKFKYYYKYDLSRGGTTGLSEFYVQIGDDPASSRINYYIDELSIIKAEGNIINGDFDFDTSIWESENIILTSSSDTPDNSSASAKIEASAGGVLGQNINFEDNTKYTLSFYAKSEPDKDIKAVIIVDGEEKTFEINEISDNWNMYRYCFESEAEHENARLEFRFNSGGEAFIDNVKIEKSKPQALNLSILGEAFTGSVMEYSYEYDSFGIDTEEGDTQAVWYAANKKSSVWKELKRESVSNLTVYSLDITPDLLDKKIRLEIIPADINGTIGETAKSDIFYIKNPIDISGGILGEISPNAVISSDFKLINNKSDALPAAVIMALYNKDGAMEDIVCGCGVAGADGGEYIFDKQLTLPNDIDGNYVRLMCWKGVYGGITDMTSLIECKILK